ncbi:MAG: disulfide bond formation protein B [Sphingomonadaceae bacterium]
MSQAQHFRANLIALLLPAALIAGALGSQFIGGLYPCEMCLWQRWPHYAAIGVALIAFALKPPARTALIALAAVAVLISAGIGAFHAGVEYRWWQGLTTCANASPGGSLADIMNAPLIRCDVAPWTLFGISLAGFNALFSGAGGIAIFAMLARKR